MLACPASPAVHDLHVWTVTSGMVAMSGHAVVPDLVAHPGVLEGIRGEMSRLGIGHVTIQLEVEHGCEGCDDPREPAAMPHLGHHGHSHHALGGAAVAAPAAAVLRHPTALSIYAPRRPGVRASYRSQTRWVSGNCRVDP